jgi:hypothetical protein
MMGSWNLPIHFGLWLGDTMRRGRFDSPLKLQSRFALQLAPGIERKFDINDDFGLGTSPIINLLTILVNIVWAGLILAGLLSLPHRSAQSILRVRRIITRLDDAVQLFWRQITAGALNLTSDCCQHQECERLSSTKRRLKQCFVSSFEQITILTVYIHSNITVRMYSNESIYADKA